MMREPIDVRTDPKMPNRSMTGHKGTFGTAMLVGGTAMTHRMIGGPCLATRAALRSGCGLAILAMPEPILDEGLGVVPEATGLALPCLDDGSLGLDATEVLEGFDVAVHGVGIGPGLGGGAGVEALVRGCVMNDSVPRVIDADALNAMATGSIDRIRGPVVLTPHPGEWRRLADALGIDGDPIDDEARPAAAMAMASTLAAGEAPVVVVLKGAGTVVSDGHRFWRCGILESALAVGGSGDVLTGLLVGLIAQFHPRPGEARSDQRMDLFDIACLSVAMHAEAGRSWVSRNGASGMLARELADEIVAVRETFMRS